MAGRFSCGAAQLAIFSSHVFMTQYHSPSLVRSMTLVLASMVRRMALHLPQEGLQHRIHSYGSFALVVTCLFLPRVKVGWRDSYASLLCKRRTHTRRCFRVRASAALSGVCDASYFSSGAEHRARSGSFLFIEQYHLDGSFFSSTTPRKRRHFLHLSHSTHVALLWPVVWPKMDPSSLSESSALAFLSPILPTSPEAPLPVLRSSSLERLPFFFFFRDARLDSRSSTDPGTAPGAVPGDPLNAPALDPVRSSHKCFRAACMRWLRSRRIGCPRYTHWVSSSSESVSTMEPLAEYWSSSNAFRICSLDAI
mmetsp:Transcript_10336/g.29468  ORF Transcript_10336/g.29468 Transcript_10336/m.29468 type:complete len:309 (-) Transcript_10336:471-1397(-)